MKQKVLVVTVLLLSFFQAKCIGERLEEEFMEIESVDDLYLEEGEFFVEEFGNYTFWEEENQFCEETQNSVLRESLRRGTNLPGGCHGGERRYSVSHPYAYSFIGRHMQVIYYIPSRYNWCHLSHHSRRNSDWADGGADAWEAVLRPDYFRGWDRVEVMIPTRYRVWLFTCCCWTNRCVANHFWLWAYHH